MTPVEKMHAELTARLERLRQSASFRIKPPWKDDALAICAKAIILHGDRAYRDERLIYGLWRGQDLCRKRHAPSIHTVTYIGGLKAIYRRIERGGLGIDRELGVWNGGFFHGLRLAGALKPYSSRQWFIWERSHAELVRDMEEMTVGNRFEKKTGRNGIRRLRRCPASYLPPEPKEGASVLAGLFAGGIIRRIEGEDWIELPAGEEIIRLFNNWTVICRPSRTYRGKPFIRVPPFYAALFVEMMPPRSLAGILALEKPAMCPILPVIYWDIALRREFLPVIPFTGALPFSCSMRTFRRRGWRRDELHHMGLELGINGVDPRLKERMAAWYEAQVRLRGKRSAAVQDAVLNDAAGQPDGPEDARNALRPEILPSATPT